MKIAPDQESSCGQGVAVSARPSPSSKTHTLEISPDWEFTKSRTKNETIFAFHSSEKCPGYSIHISDWRLRPEPRCSRGIPLPMDSFTLFSEAIEKMKKAIGNQYFLKWGQAIALVENKNKCPFGPLGQVAALEPDCPADLRLAAQDRLAKYTTRILLNALYSDLSSPKVDTLGVPLLNLIARDEVRYIFEEVPWPFRDPPRTLSKLTGTGFDSYTDKGVIALSPFGGEVWAVSRFTQCEVNTKWDRKAVLLVEFPWLKDIGKIAQSVPLLQDEIKDAREFPESIAIEIFKRIYEILKPEEQQIWHAVRNAGTQKGAVAPLRESGIIMSEATLSRRVKKIDEKLKKNKLPPCKASGPCMRFNTSGGGINGKRKTVPKELSQIDRDWADDPVSRDRTIRMYITASEEEREHFRQLYDGIVDEVEEYKKRAGMKSD